METRPAVFAGSWYPRQADTCENEIHQYLSLSQGVAPSLPDNGWFAGIVPHAGWIFSGHIACQVINLLKGGDPIDMVVIFGMHLHSRSSNQLMPHGAWETPFGALPVAEDLAQHLMSLFKFNTETPDRFVQDNTVEVQLPFIKFLLNPKRILALGVPPAPQSIEIGKAVGQWARDNGQRIRIIGSTDLTHYGPNYRFTPKGEGRDAVAWVRDQNDRRLIETILNMEPGPIIEEGLANHNACCAGAVAATVAAAGQMGAKRTHEVAYASSFDRAPGDSFVGYVGVVMG